MSQPETSGDALRRIPSIEDGDTDGVWHEADLNISEGFDGAVLFEDRLSDERWIEADPIVAHQVAFNAGIGYWIPREPPRWRMVKHWRWDAYRMQRQRQARRTLERWEGMFEPMAARRFEPFAPAIDIFLSTEPASSVIVPDRLEDLKRARGGEADEAN